MSAIPVSNLAGEQVGTVELSPAIFGVPVNQALIHQAVVKMLADQRSGTHKTKTRAHVSGGGAKPWRQKGTGRARQGSRVSPLWRGGGIVFGPQPRTYKQDMPRKMRRAAMRSGLSARCNDGAIRALDALTPATHKTRDMAGALGALDISGKVLLVDAEFDHNAQLAARNIPNVSLQHAASLNLLQVLSADTLVFTLAALEFVEKRLTDGTS